MKNILIIASLTLFSGCISRAESTNELDKALGLDAKSDQQTRDNGLALTSTHQTTKNASAVLRTEPKVIRVWIHDFEVGNDLFIQGTWANLVIEQGHLERALNTKKNDK